MARSRPPVHRFSPATVAMLRAAPPAAPAQHALPRLASGRSTTGPPKRRTQLDPRRRYAVRSRERTAYPVVPVVSAGSLVARGDLRPVARVADVHGLAAVDDDASGAEHLALLGGAGEVPRLLVAGLVGRDRGLERHRAGPV